MYGYQVGGEGCGGMDLKTGIDINALLRLSSVQFSPLSYVQLCDPMDCSTPGLPVHHQLPEFTQTQVH